MAKVATIKTQPTAVPVEDYLATVPDEQKRADCAVILQMMEKATNEKPKMWGSSIIGFCDVRYKSPASGREVDWFQIGFAPRKANITIYLMNVKKHEDALAKLGKHKAEGGCLYINKLADVDLKVLGGIIKAAAK